jgi:ubiquinone/menaquinone biosynthesis C-methylase UbiE
MVETAGTAERKFLQGIYGRAASRYADNTCPFFPFFGRRCAELADVRPGMTVLDVACGRGAALLPAVDQVGSDGFGVGVDFALPMLTLTSAPVAARASASFAVAAMDAERLAFRDGIFDRVLCSQAIPFFPSPRGMLREANRVLRQGGRLAVSVRDRPDEGWSWLDDMFREYVTIPPPVLGHRFTTDDWAAELGDLVEEAGFRVHRIQREEVVWRFRHPDEYWAFAWGGGLRAWLEAMDEDMLPAFLEDASARMKASSTREGMVMTFGGILAVAESRTPG